MRKLIFVLALLLIAFLTCGCPPKACTPNETRCLWDNKAEICDSLGQWRLLADCSDVSEWYEWSCCQVGDGCTCVPPGECDQ